MVDDVKVVLGVDNSALNSGLSKSTGQLKDSLSQMTNEVGKLGKASGDNAFKVQQHNKAIGDSFAGLHETVRARFGSINNVFEQFSTKLAGIGALFAGGALFSGMVHSFTNLNEEVAKLSLSFGMSYSQATQYAIALKLIGVSAEEYTGIAFKLLRTLKANEEGFNSLGFATRDSAKQFLPLNQLLENGVKWLQQYKPGVDQDEAALAAFGRGAKEVVNIVRLNNEMLERAAEIQHKYGIEVGNESVAATYRYKTAIATLGLIFEGLAHQLAEKVVPALTSMAEMFGTYGPTAIEVLTSVFKIFLSLIQAGQFAVRLFVEVLTTLFRVLWDVSDGISNVAQALAHLDFTGAANAAKRTWDKVVSDTKSAVDSIVQQQDEANRKLRELWVDTAAIAAAAWGGEARRGAAPDPFAAIKGGTKDWPGLPKKGGGDDRLKEWKDQLEQMKEAEGYFHEFSKAQEAAFWESKLALVQGGGKKEVALRREINRLIYADKKAAANEELQEALATFQLEIDEAKNNKDQQLSIAHARTETIKAIYGEESKQFKNELDKELKFRQEWAAKDAAVVNIHEKMVERLGEGAIELERINLDQRVKLRQASQEEMYAGEVTFENRLYELRRSMIQKELDAEAAGPRDPRKMAELDAQLEELEQSHQLKLTQIANAAELERKQYALQAAQDVQNAFGTFLSDIANQTKSLTQAFRDMVKTITTDLNKLAAEQVSKQLLGGGTAGGGFLNDIFGKIFGSGVAGGGGAAGPAAANTALAGLATTATTTTTSFTLLDTLTTALQTGFTALMTAAQSASAALLSVGGGSGGGLSGIFGGGGGFGFGDLLGSFATGTPFVPQDMLAVVHKGEAVIPASMNRVGAMGHQVNVRNTFMFDGPVDSRTQAQIAVQTQRAVEHATRRTRS